jgi:WD40 repeat protein
MKQIMRLWLAILIWGIVAYFIFAQPTEQIYQIYVSNDANSIVFLEKNRLVVYDSFFNEMASKSLENTKSLINSIAISPNGNYLAVNNEIWDILTLNNILTVDNYGQYPQWNADGTLIALRDAGSLGVSFYNTVSGDLVRQFNYGLWRSGYNPVWSPNNLYFALYGGNVIIILDAVTGNEITRYNVDDNFSSVIFSVTWSKDSTRLAVTLLRQVAMGTNNSFPDPGSFNNTNAMINSVLVVNFLDGLIISSRDGFRYPNDQITWSYDGSQIAIRNYESGFYIMDSNTGIILDHYLIPSTNMVYTPYDGRLITGFIEENLTYIASREADAFDSPITNFSQSVIFDTLQIVAPASSPQRLQTILGRCLSDSTLLGIGNSFINSGQYAEFKQWVSQQNAIPQVCKDDLYLMTDTIVSELPPILPSATPPQ